MGAVHRGRSNINGDYAVARVVNIEYDDMSPLAMPRRRTTNSLNQTICDARRQSDVFNDMHNRMHSPPEVSRRADVERSLHLTESLIQPDDIQHVQDPPSGGRRETRYVRYEREIQLHGKIFVRCDCISDRK